MFSSSSYLPSSLLDILHSYRQRQGVQLSVLQSALTGVMTVSAILSTTGILHRATPKDELHGEERVRDP